MAAEIVYACGQRATEHLLALMANGEVRWEPRARDRYGRTVALCRVDGRDLGAAMARDGWALAFVRYSGDHVAQEREVKGSRAGAVGRQLYTTLGLARGVATPLMSVWINMLSSTINDLSRSAA